LHSSNRQSSGHLCIGSDASPTTLSSATRIDQGIAQGKRGGVGHIQPAQNCKKKIQINMTNDP